MRVQNICCGRFNTFGMAKKKLPESQNAYITKQQGVDCFYSSTKLSQSNNHKKALNISLTGSMVALAERPAPVKALKEAGLDFVRTQYQRLIGKFPEDAEYYKKIASDMGLGIGEEFRLFSVVGKGQLADILQTASVQDFSLGESFSGVRNLTHRINLHNHTTASDGQLSAKEFLEAVRIYADKIAAKTPDKPYIIAITDHDILDGAKEAVEIIAKDPYKYRNLRLVPGSEISVSYVNSQHVRAPMNFELILYSANPFDKKFSAFLQKIRDGRNKTAQAYLEKVNARYPGLNLNWQDASAFHPNLGKGTSNGSLWLARDYAAAKLPNHDYGYIDYLRDEHIRPYGNLINHNITVTPEEVFDAYRESGDFGMFGVAHPGLIGADMYNSTIADECRNTYKQPNFHLVWKLFEHLKKSGRDLFRCSESNYQSYGNDFHRLPWIQYMNETAEKMGLLKAGGVDCHNKDLFSKHDVIPQQVLQELVSERFPEGA